MFWTIRWGGYNALMARLMISQVAQQIGIQASAIRYYEQIGLLPPAQRVSGQRRYDSTVLYRLAIVQQARQLGFTLTEIRQLFFGFREVTRASERWHTLSVKKLAELDQLMNGIKAIRALLRRLMENCRCNTLDECGRNMLRQVDKDALPNPALRIARKRRSTSSRPNSRRQPL